MSITPNNDTILITTLFFVKKYIILKTNPTAFKISRFTAALSPQYFSLMFILFFLVVQYLYLIIVTNLDSSPFNCCLLS